MLNIDIDFDIINLEEYLDEKNIKEIAEYIVKSEKKEKFEKKDFYISLLITNNEVIKNINKEYRNKNVPTDVLSFAYNETENISVVEIIGDIIISIDKVKEQALLYNHSEEREFFYVLTHGLLHILGYDHIEEYDEKIMRKKEEYYLSMFNYSR